MVVGECRSFPGEIKVHALTDGFEGRGGGGQACSHLVPHSKHWGLSKWVQVTCVGPAGPLPRLLMLPGGVGAPGGGAHNLRGGVVRGAKLPR